MCPAKLCEQVKALLVCVLTADAVLSADEDHKGVMKLKPKAVSRPKLSDVQGAFAKAGTQA